MTKRLFVLGLCAIVGASIARAQENVDIETTAPEDGAQGHSFMMEFGGSYLGVQLEEVTSKNMGDLGLTKESGAAITKVMKDSPAEKAGLQEKDVVVGWNGTQVASVRQLVRLVHETPVGRTVSIDVIRNGQPTTIQATIGKGGMFNGFMPGLDSSWDSQMLELNKSIEEMKPGLDSLGNYFKNYEFKFEGMPSDMMMMMCCGKPRLGVELQELTPQLAKYFGTNEGSGALISSVIDSTPAATAGLQAGDVILSIDGEAVKDAGDVRRLLADKEEGPVQIRVLRDKQEQTITATLGKKNEGSYQMFKNRQFKFDGQGPHQFELRFHGPNGEEQIIKSPSDSDDSEDQEDQESPEENDDVDFSMTTPPAHGSWFSAPPAPQPPPHWAPPAIGLIGI